MQQLKLMISLLSAWGMAIVYDQIRVNTGLDIKLLLGVSVVTILAGLYIFCQKPKETNEREV